jgi:hypothetical protein
MIIILVKRARQPPVKSQSHKPFPWAGRFRVAILSGVKLDATGRVVSFCEFTSGCLAPYWLFTGSC